MLRIISAICFSISVGALFYKKSRYYNLKGEFLGELLSFFSFVKDAIRYTRTDIVSIKRMGAKKFFTLKFLTDGINNNCYGYEKEIALFLDGLGKTDIQGQIELCERYLSQFNLIREKDMQIIEKNSKAYGALGLFGAAAFLVVFI